MPQHRNTFLHHVAASLLQRYGNDMSRLTVVFPGKRAGLFLDQALADLSPIPVWSPQYITISELFEQASPYATTDSIEGVARLYASYCRCMEDPWPLDRFYSWGEILLSDFDDIDKHLVNPHQLFTNIADIRELDDISYLTDEQQAALRQFFANFSIEAATELKQQFLRLWSHMADIYDDLQQQMHLAGVMYEGALQRDVIARLRQADAADEPFSGLDDGRTFAIVGFNVLSRVEEALFDRLQRRGQAHFYWDYDSLYVSASKGHEAGFFVQHNLQRYGNELAPDCFDNLSTPPAITIIAASSENAQARYIPTWLADTKATSPHDAPRENESAIVLANEQLLQPVLHSIPVGDEATAPRAVNITMGYPLSATPVYSLVDSLLALQTDGYDTRRQRFRIAYVRTMRRHPFTRYLPDATLFVPTFQADSPDGTEATLRLLDYLLGVLTAIPRSADAAQHLDTLNVEAVFQAYTAIVRLRDLVATPVTAEGSASSLLPVGPLLMRRLVRAVLQSRSIPFHGEPATGLQVMGVLETRALDFRHVLLLSAGEGFLPRTGADSSLIPYNLREAFGLTTLRHKVAVYAYYFYRLLQRAETVTILYNESNIGLRQNEMSRFIRQLMAETDFPLTHRRLVTEMAVAAPGSADDKSAFASAPGMGQTAAPATAAASDTATAAPRPLRLSPSAMNAYAGCPRSYYYQYVCGMRIDPDPHDGLDAILFGQVFHRAAELFYLNLRQRNDIIRASDIDPYLEQGGQRLDDIVRQAFRDEFFSKARDADGNVTGMPEDYSGILLIARDVVRTYLCQLLRNDRRNTPFRIIACEQKHYCDIDVSVATADGQSSQTVRVSTGGIIDRLDEIGSPDAEGGKLIRVVDYKTGGNAVPVNSVESLFTDSTQEKQHVFQTILYSTIIADETHRAVAPCLFYVHRAGADDYSPNIILDKQPLTDVRTVAAEFREHLKALVAEILDPSNTFPQTSDDKKCRYCNFRRLCDK